MEVLKDAPRTSAFVPVAEHQSTTPVSFHFGPPVLHYYSDRSKVFVLKGELEYAPVLSNFVARSSSQNQADQEQDKSENTNGSSNVAQITLQDIDIWVTSE